MTAEAAELPLRRVMLSTAGLAQFSHWGEAQGGTTIDLTVRVDQVDDILKSLTVFDREGAVGAVSLPGRAPLQELFRDLPFGPEALSSRSALLNALIGSEVEIEGSVKAKGRIFRVEEEAVALPDNAGQTLHHRLTLLSEKGLVQAILEDVTALRFLDADTQAQIDRALAGLAQNRAKERRTLAIGIPGAAARELSLSYVVAAPVWKTAYRLVLPKEDGKARLQGWAVVENLTGGDWKDVELSLVSGNPVALKQQLYTAFFSDRPEVPVTVSSRIMPRRDDSDARGGAAGEGMDQLQNLSGAGGRTFATQRAQNMAEPNMLAGAVIEAVAPPAPAAMDAIATPALAAEAEEASTQLIYRFPETVSLSTGHTMMVPFVDREIAAERVWLYQPETNPRRPLAAVRLRNDGQTGLPPGIVTAFDGGSDGSANFVGDAQLPLLPKGSFKFVTFALDSKTDIRRTDKGVRQSRLGKAVNGELTMTVKSRWGIDYEITPPVDEDRRIVIEEARADGWKPWGATAAAVEETPTRFRYRVEAPKGATTRGKLDLERTDAETVVLAALAPDQMFAILSGLENEGPELRRAIANLGEIVKAINRLESRRGELDAERQRIAADQERIRQNLGAVEQSSDLGQRYINKLREQEDRLAAITAEEDSIGTETTARRKAAEDLARALTL